MIVVLFSTVPREDMVTEDYVATSDLMRREVATIPGFISFNAYQGDGGSIAVVRFEDEQALEAWRIHAEHRRAQEKGRGAFYKEYWVQVCSTIREYRFEAGEGYGTELAAVFASGSAIPPNGAPRSAGTSG